MDTSNSSAMPTSQSKSISLKPVNQHSMHTHTCGELRAENIGEVVTLTGWVWRRRDFGGLVFVDLRDREGLTQVLFDPDVASEAFKTAEGIRPEWPVCITGTVQHRSEGQTNESLATGEVEILASEIEVLNTAQTPPFQIENHIDVNEDLRLRYRYVDLRRPHMARNLRLRSDFTFALREAFHKRDFTEVETPALFKSTPEGARDFLVPSRMQGGSFYALPQSPQLFKQLLMVSGLDRYIQIARCFRDEDLRSDRQPEFTQIDLEMSFVEMDDVLAIQERYLKKLFHEIKGIDIELPLRRMSYADAMERFGSDKPDLRFGFELKDISDLVKDTDFQVFSKALSSGGSVRGICIEDASDKFSRKDIDRLTDNAKHYGAKGLVWIRIEENEIKSSVNKFFSQEELAEIAKVFDAKVNDLILIAADRNKVVFDTLGFLRRHVAEILGLLDDSKYELLWVTDFPMFEKDDETGALKPMHHPFTHPKSDEIPMLDEDPSKVNAYAYDIVINGYEAGGGSIRIHEADLQNKMFKILGLSEEDCQQKFGFLMDAFKYGAPPHGGIAYGLDRLVMLLTEDLDIRDVVAFPKNQKAQCLLSGAPAEVDSEQLKELSIATDIEE